MVDTLWPADAVAGDPDYTAQQGRQAMAVYLGGRKTGRTLGADSGVPAGTPAAVITATSTMWTLLAHNGVLDLEPSAVSGAQPYAIDATKTGGITAADPTQQRVDSLFMRQDDPSTADGSALARPVPVFVTGAPGASGSPRGTAGGPPAFPVTGRCFEFAQFVVPAGGGTPAVTLVAPYVVATGGVKPCRSSAEYPPSGTRYVGQHVYDIALKQTMVWDGTNWTSVDDAGTVYDQETSTAPVTIVNTAQQYLVPGAVITVVLTSPQRLAVLARITRVVSGTAAGLYRCTAAYQSGGAITAGGATPVNSSMQNSTSGTGTAGAVSIPDDESKVFAAGTWTFGVLALRVSGGSGTDQVTGADIRVTNAGPS